MSTIDTLFAPPPAAVHRTLGDDYWLADDGRLYSSLRQVVVTTKDEDFKAWQDAHPGLNPIPWPRDEAGDQTEAELAATLERAGLYFTFDDELFARLEKAAGDLRRDVVGADPAKVVTYKLKAEVAQKALDGDADALAMVAPEAEARGVTPEQLATVWSQRSIAWQGATLQIDAITAKAKQDITATGDRQAKETAYLEALSVLAALRTALTS